MHRSDGIDQIDRWAARRVPSQAPDAGPPDPDGIVELPSFTDDDTPRPRVQMPSLTPPCARPAVDDAFDHELDDGPTTPEAPRYQPPSS